MEYISSFTYCDSIQTDFTPQGPRHQIVSPLQVLSPIALPSNYSFAIACGIAGFDVTKENSAKIQFVSPTGQIINDTGDINFQFPPEQTNPGKPSVMQINLDMRNVALREIGIHSTKIFINDIEIGEYKIPVIVGENYENSCISKQ